MRFLATASILIILLLITGEWEIKSSMKLTRRKVFAQETSANQGCRPIARIREIQGDVTIRSQRESENRRAYPGMELCKDSRVDARQGMLIIDCYETENKNIPVEGKLFFTKDCLPRNNPEYIPPKADRIPRDQFIITSTDGFASQPQRPQAVNPVVTPMNPAIVQGRPLNPIVPTPVPQGQPLSVSPLSRGVIGIGLDDNGPGVRDLQIVLEELGYYNSRLTGYFDADTYDAVIAFQRDYRIPVSGSVQEDTLSVLNKLVRITPLNRGEIGIGLDDSGPGVRDLQIFLGELGYYNLEPTGYFDAITYNAVRAFQRNNGIRETGSVQEDTLFILNN